MCRMEPVTIGHFTVSPDSPPLVIAEVGINHAGDLELAKRMVASAAANGADLIKLQSFQPEKFLAEDLLYRGEIEKLAFSFDQQQELFRHAESIGAILFSAAFDNTTADFLDEAGVPAFKIASMDCNNVPLLRHVARKQKPVFLATGMAEMEEVALAVDTIRKEGNGQIVVMHCVSDYPADPADMNLEMIRTLSAAFDLPCGLSDHSHGLDAAIAAAGMGAVAVEKHFTLDRGMAKQYPFSDHAIAIEPGELKELSAFCKKLALMRGAPGKRLTATERDGREKFRRGIYAARYLPEGLVVTDGDCVALRPVRGVSVAEWDMVMGKKLRRPLAKGEPIDFSCLE